MRQIILYIAQSADGYIARPDGAVDWLDKVPHPEGEDYGYAQFYEGVDTLIMGRKTWQVVQDMDVPWPYSGKACYVFTRNSELPAQKEVTFITSSPSEFALELKRRSGKNIWLVGGGQVNALFLSNGLVDEIRLFVMPVLLGEGLPLSSVLRGDVPLRLIRHQVHDSGVMELRYAPQPIRE